MLYTHNIVYFSLIDRPSLFDNRLYEHGISDFWMLPSSHKDQGPLLGDWSFIIYSA